MEPVEYALMDAVEDHMWWYRALRRRLLDALAGVHGTVLDAGCGTGGLLARFRIACPDLQLVGVEWADEACRRAAASPARHWCAAPSMRYRSGMPASMPQYRPTCCAIAPLSRSGRLPNWAACYAPAAGS